MTINKYYCIDDLADSETEASKFKLLLPKLFDFIHEAIINGNKVLVHCAAGISRSPTVVIGYLMCKWKIPLKYAISICKDKRPGIYPN